MFDTLERRRLLSDGFSIDTTYGTNGKTTVRAVSEAADYVQRLFSTPGGKLLVLGNSGDVSPVTHLTQFNLDGTLDTNFGTAGRKIVTEFGTTAGVTDAVVGTDGKVAVLSSANAFALKRYAANGTLDTTFNPSLSVSGRPYDLALAPSGAYFAINGSTISKITATGAADTSFDGDGQMTIAQEANFIQFAPRIIQPLADGSILVGGTYGSVSQGVKRAAFRHYSANGSLDTVFGTLNTPLSSSSDVGRMLLQPDGKVVVALRDNSTSVSYVTRINAPNGSAGSFDSGFNGNALFSPSIAGTFDESVADIELDSAGRIVGTSIAFNSSTSANETFFFRLTSAGSLDATFGPGGYKRHVFDGNVATTFEWGPRDLVIDVSSSRMFTATAIKTQTTGVQDQYLERFDLGGNADTSFGSAGKVRTSYDTPQIQRVLSIKDLGDGSVVYAGISNPSSASAFIGKVNGDGTTTGFGNGGVATVNLGGTFSYLWDVAASPGGKLVAVGRKSTFVSPSWVDDYAVARYNADGTPDLTFGSGGKISTHFTGSELEQFTRVFVTTDGTIYAAGLFQSTGGARTAAIARYTASGQVDTTFGTGGVLKLDTLFTDNPELTIAHLELVNGKLLIGGTRGPTGSNYDAFLARLSLTGVPDPTFGTAGVTRFHSSNSNGYPGFIKLITDTANSRYLTLDVSDDLNGIQHAFVRRFTFDGQLDASWANGGVATVDLANDDDLFDLDLLTDGRLRLTGTRKVSTSSSATNVDDHLFIGLTSTGAIDLDFGINGFQTLDLAKYDDGLALLPAPGGKFVLAGQISLTGNDGDFVAVRLNAGADVAPPKIASTVADFETRRAVVVDFNEDVLASLTSSKVRLQKIQNFSTTLVNATDWTFSAANVGGKTRLTITLADSLPDADYEVVVSNIADAAGNVATSLFSSRVFFLAGDANRDRKVDFGDLVILAQNYNLTGRTFSQGNFDRSLDGKVDFNDLVVLAQKYGTTAQALLAAVAPPPVAPPATKPVAVKPKAKA